MGIKFTCFLRRKYYISQAILNKCQQNHKVIISTGNPNSDHEL